RASERRLPDTRNVLEQHMATSEDRGADQANGLGIAAHYSRHLVESAERILTDISGTGRKVVGHRLHSSRAPGWIRVGPRPLLFGSPTFRGGGRSRFGTRDSCWVRAPPARAHSRRPGARGCWPGFVHG